MQTAAAEPDLLRNHDIDSPAPVTVMQALANLRVSPPYLGPVSQGQLDPDATVFTDPMKPRVLYELVNPTPVLLLTRAGSLVRVNYR